MCSFVPKYTIHYNCHIERKPRTPAKPVTLISQDLNPMIHSLAPNIAHFRCIMTKTGGLCEKPTRTGNRACAENRRAPRTTSQPGTTEFSKSTKTRGPCATAPHRCGIESGAGAIRSGRIPGRRSRANLFRMKTQRCGALRSGAPGAIGAEFFRFGSVLQFQRLGTTTWNKTLEKNHVEIINRTARTGPHPSSRATNRTRIQSASSRRPFGSLGTNGNDPE